MKVSAKKLPKILIIGGGRFGENHIRVLKKLETEGRIVIEGIVIRDKTKHVQAAARFGLKIYSAITPTLLKQIDAVDIVTPPETHFKIVKQCLPYAHVFVEKPLAMNGKDSLELDKLARKHRRLLIVGHVFRYHPAAEKLKYLVGDKGLPRKIMGEFINPINSDQGREASLELLHLFDLVDYLWAPIPKIVSSRRHGRISFVDMRYGKHQDGRFELGWRGDEKKRLLVLKYPELTLEADFVKNTITFTTNGKSTIYECPVVQEPLYLELSDFVGALVGKKSKSALSVDGAVAARVVSIAERAIPKSNKFPKIAVIGGGIFGTSIAAELGKIAKVTLFERNPELLQEGSWINQFRHHFGYHYPRSDDTVTDIKNSRDAFEAIFKKAIDTAPPTYYGLAKEGSFVTADEFIDFCKRHNLPHKKSFPAGHLLSKDALDLCVQVPEPSYHHGRLKKIIEQRLAAMPNIKILFNTVVDGCAIDTKGTKEISFISKDKKKKDSFDFIVNATYANINRLASWLDFDHSPIRVDLAEVLIVKLPIEPVSLTVIDGPFATLMPTGNKNEFTLYHVKESIINRYVPEDGLVKNPGKIQSNQEGILRESLKYFPILKEGTIVESRIVHRGVRAYSESDDSRVADLISHGFGCWSILSGKILSSVRTGERIADIIRNSIM